MKITNKYLSRTFIIVMIILGINLYCFIADKIDFISALTVLNGAVTAFVGFGSYYKEKNYKNTE
jgi:formate hydrogenlyase subunit 3/multisubunit Na+/H+ antiporter MnhD subunit